MNLKKNPPIREVVYTISPFELDIMSALWKEFPVRLLTHEDQIQYLQPHCTSQQLGSRVGLFVT